MLLLIEQYAFFVSCLWCFCASVPAQIPLFSGIIERERAICRLIKQYAFRRSLLLLCSCYSPVSWCRFGKRVLFCCACSVKNRLFFVPVLPYFCLIKSCFLYAFCSCFVPLWERVIGLLSCYFSRAGVRKVCSLR